MFKKYLEFEIARFKRFIDGTATDEDYENYSFDPYAAKPILEEVLKKYEEIEIQKYKNLLKQAQIWIEYPTGLIAEEENTLEKWNKEYEELINGN